MTFITAEHPGVNIVTENNFTDRTLNNNVLSSLMATATVTADTKCGIAIMTSAAGFAIFHLFHANQVTVAFCDKKVCMAFITAKHFGMHIMTENDLLGCTIIDFNITGMTSRAVPAGTESLVAIMAKTTGLTTLHLLHGEHRVLFGNNMKNIIVTGWTVFTDRFHLHMCIVAELYLAYRVSLQVDFIFDPATVKNRRQGHHNQDCQYHPAPCHKYPPSASANLATIILILPVRPMFKFI